MCSLNEWMNEWWKGSEINDYKNGMKIYIPFQASNFPNRFPRQALKTERVCFSAIPMNQCNFLFLFCNHKGPWLTQVSFVIELSILMFPRGTNPETLWTTMVLLPAQTCCALLPRGVLRYTLRKHILGAQGLMLHLAVPQGHSRVRNRISSWLHGMPLSKELSFLSIYCVSLWNSLFFSRFFSVFPSILSFGHRLRRIVL